MRVYCERKKEKCRADRVVGKIKILVMNVIHAYCNVFVILLCADGRIRRSVDWWTETVC